MLFFSSWLLPTLVLLAAAVDDLRSRKIHNSLIVTLFVFVLTTVMITGGLPGLKDGLMGATVALIFLLPMTLAKILGGGDLKIMVVFGLATQWQTTLYVIAFSIICAALLGIFQALFGGELKNLFANLLHILHPQKKTKPQQLHKIPYSIALLFGWLTYLSLNWERIWS